MLESRSGSSSREIRRGRKKHLRENLKKAWCVFACFALVLGLFPSLGYAQGSTTSGADTSGVEVQASSEDNSSAQDSGSSAQSGQVQGESVETSASSSSDVTGSSSSASADNGTGISTSEDSTSSEAGDNSSESAEQLSIATTLESDGVEGEGDVKATSFDVASEEYQTVQNGIDNSLDLANPEDLPTYSGGSGTAEDPYLISTAADLESLRETANTVGSSGTCFYYEQTADIDLANVQWDKGIGYSNTTYYFTGVYDGAGHEITGLNISSSNVDSEYSYIGLFGYLGYSSSDDIDYATVENLTVRGTVTNSDDVSSATGTMHKYTGGIAAYGYCSKIINCKSYVSVSSPGYMGSAYAKTYISSSSTAFTGGIAGMVTGYSDTTTTGIFDCTNYGSVSTSSFVAGGILGYSNMYTTLRNDDNEGDVTTAGCFTGGVLGVAGGYSEKVINCLNSGKVTSTMTYEDQVALSEDAPAIPNSIGGVVGYVNGGKFSIVSSCNKGDVTSAGVSVGGVVGCMGSFSWPEYGAGDSATWSSCVTTGSMTDCYNTGTVSTTATNDLVAVGGVIGVLPTSVEGSNATGCAVTGCYNIGTVSAPSITSGYVGAIAGAPYVATLNTTSGNVEGNYFLTGTAENAFGSAEKGSSYSSDFAGKALGESELKAQEIGTTYVTDSTNTINDGYPYLKWENPDATFAVTIGVSYNNTSNVGDNTPTLVVTKQGSTDAISFTMGEAASDGSREFTANLQNGTYEYTLSQEGYGATSDESDSTPVTGTFTVNKGDVSVDLELVAKTYTYTMSYTPTDANVSGLRAVTSGTTAGSTSGDSTAGTKVAKNLYNGSFYYTVSKFGYAPQRHDFTISYGSSSGSVDLVANPTHALNITFNAPTGSSFTSDTLPKIVITAKDSNGNSYNQTFTATLDSTDATKATLAVDMSEFEAAEGSSNNTYSYLISASGCNSVRGTVDMSADKDLTIDLADKTKWDGTYDISWYDPDNPKTEYTITTPEQLAGISYLVHEWGTYNQAKYQTTDFEGVTFYLANDLDLGGEELGFNWYPIGYYTAYCTFHGTFDGQGHTIKGLYCDWSSTNYLGLFGGVTNATIKNLNVEGTVSGGQDLGGLVGGSFGSTIENCSSNVVVTSNVSGANGILVGVADDSDDVLSTIKGCTSYGSVTCTGNSGKLGGIVGESTGATITNCANYGDVLSDNAYNSSSYISFYLYGAGGIAGNINADTTIEACFNTGKVHGMVAGGIVGGSRGVVSNCYNTGEITGVNANSDASSIVCVGGVVGLRRADSYYSTSNCQILNSYNIGTLTQASAGSNRCGGILGAYADSTQWPTEGSTDVVNNYYLTGCGASGAFGGYGESGTAATTAFDVTGAGESMDSATLKAAAATLGVAWSEDTDSTYNSGYPYLRWQNPDSLYAVSIVVSYDDGSNSNDTLPVVKLYNKSDDTEVAQTSQSGMSWSFDLANGEYYYTVSQEGYETVGPVDVTISGQSVTENVTLKIDKATVTFNLSPADASIVLSNSDGDQVDPTTTDTTTGVTTYSLPIGTYNYTVKKFGYTAQTGSIEVAFDDLTQDVSLTVIPTTATEFDITPASGSFNSNGATVILYQDGVERYKWTKAADDDGTVRLVQDVPQGDYTYTVVATGYAAQTGSVTVGEETQKVLLNLTEKSGWNGTADISWVDSSTYASNDHFTITSEEQLAGLAYLVNSRGYDFSGKTIELACDLNLNNRNWSPIGVYGKNFEGTFDGGGFAIDGLNIVKQSTTVSSNSLVFGLFGMTDGATIENLVVRGNITLDSLPVDSSGICAIGGIVAKADSTKILNCGSEVNINITNTQSKIAVDIGGISGWGINSNFEGCYNSGSIDVSSVTDTLDSQVMVGGLCGFSNCLTNTYEVVDCYNTGNITAEADKYVRVGGLIGSWSTYYSAGPSANMENVYNTGKIASNVNAHVDGTENYAGAIIGQFSFNDSSTVTNAHYLAGSASTGFGNVSDEEIALAVEETQETMLSSEFTTTMGEAFKQANDGNAEYYPLLKWQKDVVSATIVTMPTKLDYVDGETFDSTGMQVEVTTASGDVRTVESGWVAINGNNLRPGTTEVTLSYQGIALTVPITVSWHDQSLPSTLNYSIEAPAVGGKPQTTLTPADDSTSDANPHIIQTIVWTHAGSEMTDTHFAKASYYRAEVTLTAEYDDGGHYVFPDDLVVNVDGSFDILDFQVASDKVTFTLTFEPTSSESSGITASATHLYYEGDSSNPLVAEMIPGDGALTLIDSKGNSTELSVYDVEYDLVLQGSLGVEADYSRIENGETTTTKFTGVNLYGLLQSYGIIERGSDDSTQVTLTDTSGRTYTLTLGDIRNNRNTYDSDGNQTSTVSAMLSFAEDGVPYLKSTSLHATKAPFSVELGMRSSDDSSTLSYVNITKIEVGKKVNASQYTLGFNVKDDLGAALSDYSVTVTDASGNKVDANSDGTFSLNEAEDYIYTVTADGYTVRKNTVNMEEDSTIDVVLVPCWDGVTRTEPQKDEDGWYLIGTPEELAWWNVNATTSDNVRLTRDIAMGDTVNYVVNDEDGNLDKGNWTPMFIKEDESYTGEFDGDGHTIYGLYINRENQIDMWLSSLGEVLMLADRDSVIGMFGYTYGAKIHDLGVEGKIYVLDRPDSMYADWMQVGGIVGMAQAGTLIDNCYVNMSISVIQATGSGYIEGGDGCGYELDGVPTVCDDYVGGIAGSISRSCEIKNCYSTGSYVAEGTRSVSIGGIVGGMRTVTTGNSLVQDCYSDALIGGTPNDSVGSTTIASAMGGIAGKNGAGSSASSVGNDATATTGSSVEAATGAVPDGMGITSSDYEESLAIVSDEMQVCSIDELENLGEMTSGNGKVAKSASAGDSEDGIIGLDADGQAVTMSGGVPYIEHCVALNTIIDGKLDTDNTSDRTIANRVCGLDNGKHTDNYALSNMQVQNANQSDAFGVDTVNGADITAVDSRYSSTYTGVGWSTDLWKFPSSHTPILYWQDLADISPSIVDNFTSTPVKEDSGFDFTVSLQVDGHDVVRLKTYTFADMEKMASKDSMDGTKYYSSYSGYGAAGRVVTEYVYLQTILDDLNLSFGSGDVWEMGLDYPYNTYFKNPRYYFPNWDSGSSEGKVEIDPVIAIKSYGGSSGMSEDALKMYASSADTLWTYVLNFGQSSVYDITYPYFYYQQDAATMIYPEDDIAEGAVVDLLKEIVDQANADLASVVQGENELQVPVGETFVTPEEYGKLKDVVDAAQAVLDSESSTNDEVMTSYEDLVSAISEFDSAKKTGTYEAGTVDLSSALTVAEGLVSNTIIDTSGANVDKTHSWTTPDQLAAIDEYIQDAQDLLKSSDLLDQTTLSQITSDFLDQIENFENATKRGSATGLDKVIRRSGAGREETAVAASESAFPISADTVVIASGDKFPDALGGSALAGLEDAPVILCSDKGLGKEAIAEVKRLGATKAVILGGAASVPNTVVDQLGELGISSSNITRVSGSDRYGTNLATYEYGEGQWGDTAIVASGTKYPDSLSISSYSYSQKSPIFLVGADGTLSDEAEAAIQEGGFKRVIIMGGSSAVSSSVESTIESMGVSDMEVIRFAGKDRWDTNKKVNDWLLSSDSESGMTVENVGFVIGGKAKGEKGEDNRFADALGGSALLGSKNSVLYLVNPDDTQDSIDAIAPNASKVDHAYIIGGTARISDAFAKALNEALTSN
ncbi:MAG: cell wall-binding repeat-containing protein [Coriobacteriales bacterium]|jgi:putative cell wall-binding protein